MRLANRRALITGGASGIGAACARLFLSEGASVALIDRDEAPVMALAEKLQAETNGAVFAAAADVTDHDAVHAAMDAANASLGSFDVLVNCAGITARHLPPDMPWLEGWQTVMDVNVKGTVIASTLFCERAMAAEHGGAIINLSSIYGQVGRPEPISASPDPYTHSKGAVLQITRDFAVDYAARGIRVNALCPGFIETPMTIALRENDDVRASLIERHPMGRLGHADEVARCALFLASDEASFVTGAALPVDGGYLAQ